MDASLSHKIENLRREADQIRKEIQARLAAMPDNPRVHRISDKAFVMSWRRVGKSWSVEYHDFNYQYGAIAKALEGMDVLQIPAFIKSLIDKGVFRISSQHKVKLHPDVREQLRTLLD